MFVVLYSNQLKQRIMTGLAAVPFDLNSKSEAIKYAISIAMNTDRNGKLSVDLVLAAGVYNFITERINLPDVPRDLVSEACDPLLESMKKSLNKINKKLDKEEEVG
jgi:hypothetical protein